VPIDGVIAMTAARLGMHGDPGDRFIVATALTHGATLMTADEKIQSMKSLRTTDPRR
jgi:PIN domain nuclease of toxin-antitoxin system